MRKLVSVLALIIIAGGLAGALAAQPKVPDYARQARQERLATALEPVDVVTGALWRLVPLAAAVGALCWLGALGVAHIARFRRYARPDAAGRLPIALEDHGAARAALAATHATELARAQVQPVPHSYAPHSTISYAPHESYAPRVDYRAERSGAADTPAAELLPAAGAPAVVPSFAELLERGRIGRGNPLLLGYDRDTGAEIAGSWLDLYSCAVGGLSGSGKSWTATFLAAQAALFGSRLLILDPHAESAESLAARLAPLAARFVCAPAATPTEMLAAVRLAGTELERRKAGGYQRGSAPWVIIADEFSALQRGELAEPLAQLLEALAQEGRKLDLFGLVAGQVWTASRAGGTELRDSLASAYVHRLRPAQARVLTGYAASDLPPDLLELPTGHAYMLSTAGELRPVVIPKMSPADVARVAALAGGDQATSDRPANLPADAWRTPDGSLMEATLEQASRSSVSAEAARALALFRGGHDLPQIVKALRNIETSSGRRYQEAAREVQQLLRDALG